MKELNTILLWHAQHYPLMEPQDAVKLIYQNEFGGAHMIQDPEHCIAQLHQEYAATEKNPSIPLYEHIGNEVIRVNLAALQAEDVEALGQAFLESAKNHRGTLDRFRIKLSVLTALACDGAFSFSAEDLQAYLIKYEQAGFPMVSHSFAYRCAYAPAYRVLSK